MATKTKELATKTDYIALAASAGALAETVGENLGDDTITDRDLDRVLIPAGGGRAWEIPSIDGVETAETLEGIIVHWTMPRAYWRESLEQSGGKAPPDCFSADGLVGIGDPGGDCTVCPHNQWGTAISTNGEPGPGKACKEKRLLFVLRPSDTIPLVVQAPSTSIAPIRKYLMRLAQSALPYYAVVTQLGLERVEGGPFVYSRITLQLVDWLGDEMVNRIREYRAAISPTLGASVVQDEG